MVGINPGQLREVVAFQKLTRVPNDSGGHDPVWSLAFKTFANVDKEKHNRNIESGQLVQISTREVLIRYSPTRKVTVDMKMVWKTREYQIVAVGDVDEPSMLIPLTVTRSK